MQQLTHDGSLNRRTSLSTLMEESPPPVPPKDDKYQRKMELDRPMTVSLSGSKRKRATQYGDLDDDESWDGEDDYEDTPRKRRNSGVDASASEDAAPSQPRNVRRKRGSRNLSNLNLRHAAEQQDAPLQTLNNRESRFQEGSLTDKPSDKPPSIYTRAARPESSGLEHYMERYHNGAPTPRESLDRGDDYPHASLDMNIDEVKKDDGAGFFQFGRSWAASFNPTSLWRRLWSEPKDEIVEQQVAEAERKAQQKFAAEATYAQMKRSGQLGLQPVGRLANADGVTPRDSGIDFGSFGQSRSDSQASGLSQHNEPESGVPDTAAKKTLKSRLHFKKPSLSNIKHDLKRAGSDLNLTATIRRRESSSSLSPLKANFSSSTLHRSESRYDIKKTQKLSKRISDLEVKLDRARAEQARAFAEATAPPKLTPKYERFTSANGTFRRPKFLPGRLPSLPSERLLMAEQAMADAGEERESVMPRKALDLAEVVDEADEGADDATIREARGKTYPRRASSLFGLDEHVKIEADATEGATADISMDQDITQQPTDDQELTTEVNKQTSTTAIMIEFSVPAAMDSTESIATPAESEKQTDYKTLDDKLKALDKNAKLASKAKKPKKRKSGNNDGDKLFKPGRGTSDDEDKDWEQLTPRKKRKSGHTGAQQVKSKSSPPKAKKKGAINSASISPKVEAADEEKGAADDFDTLMNEPAAFSPENPSDVDDAAAQAGVDTQPLPLDVVYEEEEEANHTKVTTTDPVKPRFNGLRSRSESPHKHARSRSVQPAVTDELVVMLRAADAAKTSPARRVGTPPGQHSVEGSVTPGQGGVPGLPFEGLDNLGKEREVEEAVINGTGEVQIRKVRVNGMGKKGSFEWPEDVF